MTRTTCFDRGIPEFEEVVGAGAGEGDGEVGDGSAGGFAAVGAGDVAGAGWLVACGGTLRGIAPQPEIKSVVKHNRQSNALDGRNSNFILPPREDPRLKSMSGLSREASR